MNSIPESGKPYSFHHRPSKEKVLDTIRDAGQSSEEFVREIAAMEQPNGSNSLGVATVLFLHKKGLLDNFAEWAIHPKSGFIATHQEIRPLQEPLAEEMQYFVKNYNKIVKNTQSGSWKEFLQNELKEAATISKTTLKGAVIGVVIGTGGIVLYDELGPDFLERLANYSALGGTLWGLAECFNIMSEKDAKKAIRQFNLDETTDAAAKLLEQYCKNKLQVRDL